MTSLKRAAMVQVCCTNKKGLRCSLSLAYYTRPLTPRHTTVKERVYKDRRDCDTFAQDTHARNLMDRLQKHATHVAQIMTVVR